MHEFRTQKGIGLKGNMAYNGMSLKEIMKHNERPKNSFKVSIKRYFTNVAGTLKDKATLPATFQLDFPVYLFGEFDRSGGYLKTHANTPPQLDSKFITSFVVGNTFDFISFTGINNVKQYFRLGDFILLFADDANNPTYFCWVVISGEQRSYSSFLQNPLNVGFDMFKIKMFSDNVLQYDEPVQFIGLDSIGNNKKSDYLSPLIFRQVYYEQNDQIEMDVDFNLNNYLGLATYFKFDSEQLNFIFHYYKS